MEHLARALTIAGILLVVLGLLLQLGPSLPLLGKLPGDLRFERPGFTLYVPLATCALLSVALSVALWVLSKLR